MTEISSIEHYLGTRIPNSWKIVSRRLDLFTFGHFINLLEAALEQGTRLGRVESMERPESFQRLAGREINAIEKATC